MTDRMQEAAPLAGGSRFRVPPLAALCWRSCGCLI